MQIEVPIAELRKKKIFVATPMYGGMCSGMYTKACCDLATTATKYQIDLNVEVSYRKVNDGKENSFNVKQNGTYDVSSQHSQTLNNEKKLIDLLINNIGEKIIDQLVDNFNDL